MSATLATDADDFQQWCMDVDAGRGLARLIERKFCPLCEQYTLTAVWHEEFLVLHCPCFPRPATRGN